MSIRLWNLSALAVVFAAGIVLPRPGAAQSLLTKSAPAASAVVSLESRARVLIDSPRKWPDVARMLEQAAALRADDDVRAVEDLMIAAAAHHWAHERAPARATYEAAGERALALGDVMRAAQAYLCAAVIAHEQRDDSAAWELKSRAERLAQSPLLTEAQRKYILSQFVELKEAAERP